MPACVQSIAHEADGKLRMNYIEIDVNIRRVGGLNIQRFFELVAIEVRLFADEFEA